MLDTGQLGIVAGTRNLKTALEFVRFATTAESMAAVSGYIAYSPARRSSLPLLGTHVEAGVDMNPHMPTYPDNGDVPAAVEFGRVAAAPVNTLRQQTHRCQEISVCF